MVLCACGEKSASDSNSETEEAEVTTEAEVQEETAAEETTEAGTTTTAAKKTTSTTAKTTTTTAETTGAKETTTETAAETTASTAAGETSAADADGEETTTTTAASDKKTGDKSGYESAFEAAQTYYNAYLSDNASLIYSMFNQSEIDGYKKFIDESKALGERTSDVVFRQAAVESAISESIENMRIFMGADKAEAKKWKSDLTEKDLKEVTEDDLKEYNDTLGTKFTSGMYCESVSYENETGESRVSGIDCVFLEIDGRWYLSYSSMLSTELISYLDIF